VALPLGTRFGPYEIQSAIGAGGMGEVYRATDTNLKRAVAIKVLPDALASDAERLMRFRREAEVLASLNHPNIAALYGLENADGVMALVMELVEGADLAERIARGAMPIDEALPIAAQIADALAAAHEQGIIHRDLKPANIKLRSDGTVKVLDFGLAKALEPANAISQSVTQSPTMMSPAGMTRMGMLLGTAAYMSPEQAKGRPADRRSDVWAFGCVLFEMLTGRRAFDGEEVTDTLAEVLKGTPDWTALPATTPQSIRRLLRRCLEKDRKERLADLGTARLDIKDALSVPADEPLREPPPSWWHRLLPVGPAVLVTALLAGYGAWSVARSAPRPAGPVTKSLLAVRPFGQPTPGAAQDARANIRPNRSAIALSPDGRILVLQATGEKGVQLYQRRLEDLHATAIPGTQGADSPFFSPDGAWIGFQAAGELRRVPISGGPPSRICTLPRDGAAGVVGASWGDGDVIVFATAGLWRVSAHGGQPEAVTTPAADEYGHRLPHVLPGGELVLYTVARQVMRWDNAQIAIKSITNGEQKVLLEDAADGRYVPGYLVFVRSGALMAAPFDVGTRQVGGPVTLVEDVMQAARMPRPADDSGAGQFAVAGGALVYASGGVNPQQQSELVWVDRMAARRAPADLSANVEPLGFPARDYQFPRLSPDGTRLTFFNSYTGANRRIWLYDFSRRTPPMPLTPPEEGGAWAIWMDDERIVFSSSIGGAGLNLSTRRVTDSGRSEPLTTGRRSLRPASWSAAHKTILATQDSGAISALDMTGPERRERVVVQDPGAPVGDPAFSPDGRWVAYTSTDSGRQEVVVQPYPGSGERVPVSPGGGRAPVWRRDGAELFYTTPDGYTTPDRPGNTMTMMAVSVSVMADRLLIGPPRSLFSDRFLPAGFLPNYDLTADGQRFLMVRNVDPAPEPQTELVLVQNWFEELKARVPTK
jgi:eukaryotic-like serine/threonine-protein kinase